MGRDGVCFRCRLNAGESRWTASGSVCWRVEKPGLHTERLPSRQTGSRLPLSSRMSRFVFLWWSFSSEVSRHGETRQTSRGGSVLTLNRLINLQRISSINRFPHKMSENSRKCLLYLSRAQICSVYCHFSQRKASDQTNVWRFCLKNPIRIFRYRKSCWLIFSRSTNR